MFNSEEITITIDIEVDHNIDTHRLSENGQERAQAIVEARLEEIKDELMQAFDDAADGVLRYESADLQSDGELVYDDGESPMDPTFDPTVTIG